MTKDPDPPKRTITPLTACLAVWVIVVLVYNAYGREISAALWILEAIPLLALGLTGIFFVVWELITLVKSRLRARSSFVTLIAIAATVGCLRYNVPEKARWRFAVLPAYERRIAALKSLPNFEWDSYCRRQGCSIDRSIADGVLRVAFIEPGGILDNYTAIVYDPSGLVMRANELKGDLATGNDYALFRVKRLFGGDMIWATPLANSIYRCGFT